MVLLNLRFVYDSNSGFEKRFEIILEYQTILKWPSLKERITTALKYQTLVVDNFVLAYHYCL